MYAFRAFLLSNRQLAALMIAAALCMKALIPAGYMIGADSKLLTVQICADSLGHAVTKQIAIPQEGHAPGKQSQMDGTCAFTSLGHATLGGADPIQLAIALAFILALGFAPLVTPAPRPISHLRPPLRGPPALA